MPLSGTAEEIQALSSILVGVPAVWESIRKSIVAKINSGESNHESHFQRCYLCTSQFLRSSQIPSFRPKWELLLEVDYVLHWVECCYQPWHSGFLIAALVTEWQSCGMCAILPPELMCHGEVCIRGPSVASVFNGYKRPKITSSKFLTVLVPFRFSNLPQNIMSTTSPTHSCISRSFLYHSRVHYYDLSPSEPVLELWRTKGEFPPYLYY